MSHGRRALAGTARVATRAICQPCNLALPNRLPLLTVAQSSGQGERTGVSLRWIPRPQRPRDADNLAVALRSKIPAVEGIGMGLDAEEMAFEEPRSPLPERQRTAFAIMIRSGRKAIKERPCGKSPSRTGSSIITRHHA